MPSLSATSVRLNSPWASLISLMFMEICSQFAEKLCEPSTYGMKTKMGVGVLRVDAKVLAELLRLPQGTLIAGADIDYRVGQDLVSFIVKHPDLPSATEGQCPEVVTYSITKQPETFVSKWETTRTT